MQFIVSSNQLLRQLQTLSGVLSNSNTLPILDHFLFELAPGELVMTASDLETTMSSKMEVRTDDTGAIAVPAKMLLDILKAFPRHSFDPEGGCGNARGGIDKRRGQVQVDRRQRR